MRKVSIVALVVILASAFAVIGVADPGDTPASDTPASDTPSDSANVTMTVGSFMSLEILTGKSPSFGNVDPTSSHTLEQATKLKVKSNEDWEITTDVGSSENPSPAADYLSVLPSSGSSFSGNGTVSDIWANYELANTEDLASGSYTITVTFTVAPSE